MEASLMQGWVKASRLLALVNKGPTHGLVILLTSRNPPQVYSDLTIERVLPIDQEFKCDIGKKLYLFIQVFNKFMIINRLIINNRYW